ncbi:O-methyltransferase [Allosalinactinospora lopnorensis]|uniref:class I SAM-dependent methyltransferase n=1 Tax=Allosalinactinospora lopnorensis TaxID=1352348 RepID=UPI000623BF27|nr:class I SAM-dependent methyltransferase [Allosalinactinospora lopnorensis]
MSSTDVVRSTPHVALELTWVSDDYLGRLHPDLRRFAVRRLVDDTVADLEELHAQAEHTVKGERRDGIVEDLTGAAVRRDGDQLVISGQQVMQDWERPLMAELSRIAARSHGDVLEVGFGMGISAGLLQQEGVRSHTIIESNPEVAEAARKWKSEHPDSDIRIVEGRWQDVIETLGEFDGVLFDTYPANEREYEQYVVRDAAYIQHFLPSAAAHMRPGAVLSYYTMEIDSLSRRHQRALLGYFRSIELSVVSGLAPPPDCTYWWADSMAAVAAVR